MTGPEHYREAEELLARAEPLYGSSGSDAHGARLLARAQVHATLALAAATAINPNEYSMNRPEWSEWAAVASVETAKSQGVRS